MLAQCSKITLYIGNISCKTLLNLFNTFDDYTPSSYLGLTSKLNERKELVKFRIGNHKLRLETGDMIKFQGLADSALFVHMYIYCNKHSLLRNKFYDKLEQSILTFKQLSSSQAIRPLA